MRSFVLILVVSSLVLLSAPKLQSNESANLGQAKGNSMSQPPSPTPPETVQQPNPNAEKHQQSPKVSPAISDQPQPTNHADKKKDYTSPEWWMVYITGVLVLVTACLAWYTAGLFGVTKRLADDAQQTSNRQAGEMRESLNIAAISAEAAAKNFNLSREDHIATHRPHIRVRKIAVHKDKKGALGVQYIVVNAGAGRGRIIETGTRLWLPNKWPSIIQDFRASNIQQRDNIEAASGNEMPFTHSVTDIELIKEYGFRSAEGNEQPIIFYGYITYLDNLDRRHRTGFLRHFDRTTMSFRAIPNPDWEYQD
jgi:hypothetical protein